MNSPFPFFMSEKTTTPKFPTSGTTGPTNRPVSLATVIHGGKMQIGFRPAPKIRCEDEIVHELVELNVN